MKQHFDWGGLVPCPRPQKTFSDRKVRTVTRFCPVMPVTEKKPDYYLYSQVLFHPKLGS